MNLGSFISTFVIFFIVISIIFYVKDGEWFFNKIDPYRPKKPKSLAKFKDIQDLNKRINDIDDDILYVKATMMRAENVKGKFWIYKEDVPNGSNYIQRQISYSLPEDPEKWIEVKTNG